MWNNLENKIIPGANDTTMYAEVRSSDLFNVEDQDILTRRLQCVISKYFDP